MAFTFTLVYAAASLFLSAQTVADDIRAEEMRKLKTCLELVEEDETAAYEMSLEWQYEGNRPGARECKASALIRMGDYEEGALQLEQLANAPDGGTLQDRAHFLSKAGSAWLMAGLPEEAIIAFDNAETLDDENYDIKKYRAQAYLAQERWQDAEKDLDIAIGNQPGDLTAYLFRAEARLQQNRFDDALADIDQARAIDNENIDALLLRGQIREAKRLAME